MRAIGHFNTRKTAATALPEKKGGNYSFPIPNAALRSQSMNDPVDQKVDPGLAGTPHGLFRAPVGISAREGAEAEPFIRSVSRVT